MVNPQTPSPSASPFWDLLFHAEGIKIVENTPIPTIPSSTLFQKNKNFSQLRCFQVEIETSPPIQNSIQNQNRTSLLTSTKLLIQNKDYLLAKNLCKFLLQQHRCDEEAKKLLGICFFHLGEWLSAQQCFTQVLDKKQTDEIYYWLAKSMLKQGNDAQALRYFQKVSLPHKTLSLDEVIDFLKETGNCYLRLGKWQEAQIMYEQAIQIQPNSIPVLLNLATLQLQKGQIQQASQLFRQILQTTPDCTKALCGLGFCLITAQKENQALSLFLSILKKHPNHLLAIYYVAHLCREKAQLPTVRKCLENFIPFSQKSPEVHYVLGAILYKENNYRESRKHLEICLDLAPGHLKAKKLIKKLTEIAF